MWWLWIPLGIIVVVLVFFLLLLVLGRVRNGALLRPMVVRLARIGFMQRFFQRISTAAMERQNPELASAVRKLNTVASNPNPQAVQKAMSRLTPAERRVASLVVEGHTNREVAAALFLTEKTVASHLSHIYAKLGVRSRTELARRLH